MSQRHRGVNPIRRSWPRRRLGLRGDGYPGGHDWCGWWAATALPAVVSSQAALPRTAPSTSDADQRPEVSAGSLAGVVVVGVIALAAAVFVARLQQVIGLTLAAACLALITLPFQRWLQRWIGGVASMIVTAIGSLAAAVTLGYAVLRDLRNQAAAVAGSGAGATRSGSTGFLRRSRGLVVAARCRHRRMVVTRAVDRGRRQRGWHGGRASARLAAGGGDPRRLLPVERAHDRRLGRRSVATRHIRTRAARCPGRRPRVPARSRAARHRLRPTLAAVGRSGVGCSCDGLLTV